ncbi:MAG: phosphatase PAP2 family protein [Peptococcaceae bacterium]|nr:phosphatase PAP2 family protein [Peptococcaceae bacterium]
MIMDANFWILDWIQQHLRSPFGDVVVPLITSLGNAGILWILIGLVLLSRPSWRKAGVVLLLALLIEAFFCNIVLKNLVAMPRPFTLHENVQLLIPAPHDYSFPSGHTGAAFASAAALYFSRARYWIVVFVLAVFIAFSRLYLYVHFPTDVLAGIVLGIASAWLAEQCVSAIGRRYFEQKD